METSVKQRLVAFYENMGLSKRGFERLVGLSNGYIDKLRNSPSPDKLEKIYLQFPQLNRIWLLTGEGEMIVNSTLQDGYSTSTGTPFFSDLPVSAGRVMQYPTIMQEMPSGSIDIPQAKGVEFFFPVIGMSMLPTIEEGDIIGVCHIDRYETTNADRLYMIVTRDNERMIKRILKYDREAGTITLGSDNPNYPSFDLETDLVVDVYKVVLHLKIETM